MRKKVVFVLISILFLSCKKESENEISKDPKVKSEIVSNFLKDINSLKDVKKPIQKFQEDVIGIAVKTTNFNKENINEVLKDAQNYVTMVIVVSDHTIVKIDAIKKCKNSGSWSACMPFAKGFIKKGKLIYKEDYCNNIIGIPDSQVRTAYFFK